MNLKIDSPNDNVSIYFGRLRLESTKSVVHLKPKRRKTVKSHEQENKLLSTVIKVKCGDATFSFHKLKSKMKLKQTWSRNNIGHIKYLSL